MRQSLFILALVLSQWLAIAHAAAHPALALDLDCAICLHAQGHHGALPGAAPTLPPTPALGAVPEAAPPARTCTAAPVHQPIRGPPDRSV
ncbi:hypothetical protein [Fontimonas thermophila]|uniref:hypothetical protein n=1 Tax=Fontimonas thermophila TaxID=1076937 RepID=UPI001F1F5772|nr:hypothetical protein [Fontimonas thermophila]